jgi:hypothetical protein
MSDSQARFSGRKDSVASQKVSYCRPARRNDPFCKNVIFSFPEGDILDLCPCGASQVRKVIPGTEHGYQGTNPDAVEAG